MNDVRRIIEDFRLDLVERHDENMEYWKKNRDAGDDKAADAFVHRANECSAICEMLDGVLLRLRKEERLNDEF